MQTSHLNELIKGRRNLTETDYRITLAAQKQGTSISTFIRNALSKAVVMP